jgi:hypothetical protein
MKTTTQLLVVGGLGIAAIIGACGDDESAVTSPTSTVTSTSTGGGGAATTTTSSTGGMTGTGGGGGTGDPPPPTLSTTQIDRMGRAAINTALTNTFGTIPTETREVSEDKYNENADPTTWGSSYTADIAKNLAIYDSVDTPTPNGCGNQPLAGGSKAAGAYDALAAVLADDRLRVYGGTGTCAKYLHVEASVVGSTTPADCGGRKPSYDAMDVTYSFLVGLAFDPPAFGDNVATPASAQVTTFPYLAAPNN